MAVRRNNPKVRAIVATPSTALGTPRRCHNETARFTKGAHSKRRPMRFVADTT